MSASSSSPFLSSSSSFSIFISFSSSSFFILFLPFSHLFLYLIVFLIPLPLSIPTHHFILPLTSTEISIVSLSSSYSCAMRVVSALGVWGLTWVCAANLILPLPRPSGVCVCVCLSVYVIYVDACVCLPMSLSSIVP